MTDPQVLAFLTPAWRWIFYLGAPLAILALVCTWAAAPAWPRPTERRGLDVFGASLFTAALASGLLTLTRVADDDASFPTAIQLGLVTVVLAVLATIRNLRAKDPFLDLKLLRGRVFSSAVLLSLLTGYALATALIGAAVYVDRVRYAGPEEQRLVLGALALAMAVGALASGLAMRFLSAVVLSLLGLALGIGGLLLFAGAGPDTDLSVVVLGVSLFGAGFGLTVTPRSSAAMEAVGRRHFGVASAGVTVARMVGMAVGLAVLTGLGSRRIESLSVVLVDPVARDAVLPEILRGRPLADLLVIEALERWASQQAASILSGLMIVAAVVLAIAVIPTLMMGNAPSRVADRRTIRADDQRDGDEAAEPALAL